MAKQSLGNGEKLLEILQEFSGRVNREIRCIETGQVFPTAKEAAEWAGCAGTNIVQCCRGKYKSMKGYKWEYVRSEM